MSDILTPVGRLVSGHPMVLHPMTDNSGQPRINAMGEAMQNLSVGVAIPKGPETHWNQTPWGMAIHAAAVAAWPNGEHGAPTFAWKIQDGDSTVPNKKGNKPCDNEAWPGHWVLFANTMFLIPTFHAGKYQAHEVIKDKNEIKTGDYVRLNFTCVSNKSTDSPGMYINPVLLELSRAGVQIVSKNAPDAAAVFGGAAPVIPQNAAVDTGVAVAPALDLVGPGATTELPPVIETVAPPVVEESYSYNGKVFTKTQLLAMPGWTEAHLVNLPRV